MSLKIIKYYLYRLERVIWLRARLRWLDRIDNMIIKHKLTIGKFRVR